MGTSVKTLSRLLDLHARHLLPSGASVLDLGAQEIYAKGNEDYIRSFIQYFSDRDSRLRPAGAYSEEEIAQMADRSYAGELLVASGVKYQSLDIFNGYNTILFDLNIHQPGQIIPNQFDLVMNLGTTEHVINQYQSMKSIHEFTKIDGLIYHLPMSGYHMHGYFSYNPLFFLHLEIANDYEIVMQAYLKGEMASTPQFMMDNGFPDPGFADVGIEFIFRKTSGQPFRLPLETSTSLGLDDSVWTARNPNHEGGRARRALGGFRAFTRRQLPAVVDEMSRSLLRVGGAARVAVAVPQSHRPLVQPLTVGSYAPNAG